MKTLLVIVTCLTLALQLGEPKELTQPDRSESELQTAGQALYQRLSGLPPLQTKEEKPPAGPEEGPDAAQPDEKEQPAPAVQEPAEAAEPEATYTQEDVDLLARLIYCEMGCSWIPDEQQRKVGSVVLNRMASELYPDTLQEVIYQPGQYSPAASGWLETAIADERTVENAKWLLENGSILPAGVLGQSTVALGTVHSSYYDAVLGTTTYYFYLN